MRQCLLVLVWAPLVLLGCSSTSPADTAEHSSSGDSGVQADSGGNSDASAFGDASTAHLDGGSSDAGTGGSLCATCAAERCTPGAYDCLGDPACMAVQACIDACQTIECANGCTTNTALRTNADALSECESESCVLPCSSALPPQACVPFKGLCDPLETTCCEGTCPAHGGNCCYSQGHACTDATDCCGYETGTTACAGGTCVPLTCYSVSSTSNYCTTSLPCCDTRLACTSLGGILGMACCAPNGTIVQASEHELCCSAGSSMNADGTLTCVAQPPH